MRRHERPDAGPSIGWLVVAALVLVNGLLAAHVSVAAAGEADASGGGSDAMAFFEGWAGRWEGEGWMRRGPGEPARFTSLERVERRLDGQAVLVEGLHHGPAGEVVHHALAMITADAAGGDYDFRSFVSGQGTRNAEGHVAGEAFVWGFETPRGTVRYTIRIADGAWNEIGEFSADGEAWSQFFQMDLRRVGDSATTH